MMLQVTNTTANEDKTNEYYNVDSTMNVSKTKESYNEILYNKRRYNVIFWAFKS
jgi:hypothetical protein